MNSAQPWAIPNGLILRNVRQYASSVGLNSNDEEHANVTSYSTRVERLQKLPGAKKWVLTLRKFEILPHSGGEIRAEWWTETFDAVVVSTGRYDAPWVPDIPGLSDWARAYPGEVYHSRNYRSPKDHRGKVDNVQRPHMRYSITFVRTECPSRGRRRFGVRDRSKPCGLC
jgi:hypothetical protein